VARFNKKKAKKIKFIKIEKGKVITLLIILFSEETDYSLLNNSSFIALALFAKLFKPKILLSKKHL